MNESHPSLDLKEPEGSSETVNPSEPTEPTDPAKPVDTVEPTDPPNPHDQSRYMGQKPYGNSIPPEFNIEAREMVRAIRNELGWTIVDTGRATGYHRTAISAMEIGRSRPPFEYYLFMRSRLEKLREMERLLKESGGGRVEFKAKPRLKRRVRKDVMERRVDMKEIDMGENRAKLMMMKERAERAEGAKKKGGNVFHEDLDDFNDI